ncbi:hypothetical protein Tco_0548266 [Tanacetum coccineum]
MEVDVYVKEDVLVVEQHMVEVRFINEYSKGLVIEEIVQEVGLNEDVKEDLGNKGKYFNTSPKKWTLLWIDRKIWYKTAEMKENLSEENPSLDEIFDDMNSSVDNVIAKLSQDDMDMP